jgi:hypothetical protein
MKTFTLALLVTAALLRAADFPQAEISNGQIRAKLYLPDPEKGYYRATRFDWSGSIASLEFKGHNYFGVWFPKYDPKLHDSITGPVEEYRTGESGLGYQDAKVGGNFIRIGVGVLRKPEEQRFGQFKTYEIVDPGKWTVHPKPDSVEYIQQLADPSTGYAYLYKKVVRLVKGKPQMTIEHSLKNNGKKPIETNVYNHNFFVIDGEPTGPDFSVKFPFDVKAAANMRGLADVNGKELFYNKELVQGQSAATELTGFSATPKDFDIRVENKKVGAGVRVTADQPLSRIYFWSIRTVLSPEPYINLKVDPGKEVHWKLTYDFYTFTPASKLGVPAQ